MHQGIPIAARLFMLVNAAMQVQRGGRDISQEARSAIRMLDNQPAYHSSGTEQRKRRKVLKSIHSMNGRRK